MVKINESKCVDGPRIDAILRRIEKIKSDAIIVKKGEEKHGLQKNVE